MSNTINYDPNTPTVTLPYADWQIQFVQNFTQFNTAFSQNHVPLTDASNQGNHTYVQMPELKDDPQTGAVEFTIFSKNVEDQTDQVFFVYPGNTPIVQFTNYQIYSVLPRISPNTPQTSYFSFLPGGFLIYFGSFGPFNIANGGNTLFLYPPVAKNIAGINLCVQGTTPNYTPEAVTSSIIFDPIKGLIKNESGIIKEIYIIPHTGSANTTINYLVIANI